MSPATPGREALVLTLRDGLELHAPGGVFVPEAAALVVADVHAGYAPTLRARGYGVPCADDAELLARMGRLLAETEARHVVVAGDLVHGAAALAPRPGGGSPLEEFVDAVGRRTLTVVLGNHDRAIGDALARRGIAVTRSASLGRHVVQHGDDAAMARAARASARAAGGRLFLGHLHPAVGLDDGAGARARVPAFVTAAGLICLPALSPLARGGDVRSDALQAQLSAIVDPPEVGVAAVVGRRVLSLGMPFAGASPSHFTRTRQDASEDGNRG